MNQARISPAPVPVALPAVLPAAGIGSAPPLEAGEAVLREGVGVRLGWQPRTILIWWLPGIVFITIGWFEFQSAVVTGGMLLFCGLLFGFYAQDREVRPPGGRRLYVLTNRRLLIRNGASAWRPISLDEVAATHMEAGFADRVVARLSGAATIVLEMRDPGPKGEPRRVRIGPLKRPVEFCHALDAGLGGV